MSNPLSLRAAFTMRETAPGPMPGSRKIQVAVAVAAGLTTIIGTGWKMASDYVELKQHVAQMTQRLDRFEQEDSQFRHFILVPSSTSISSAQALAGAWNLSYAGRNGRLGVRALSNEIIEVTGDISRGATSSLSVTGRGILKKPDPTAVTDAERRSRVEFNFLTKGSRPGEEWKGTGVLYGISPDFLQGWYDDQRSRHERIEVKRAF